MVSDATALELVLLFLVACIGIPSTALAVASLAEVAVVGLRLRAAKQLNAARAHELAARVWDGVDVESVVL
jgi:hypothetical protein